VHHPCCLPSHIPTHAHDNLIFQVGPPPFPPLLFPFRSRIPTSSFARTSLRSVLPIRALPQARLAFPVWRVVLVVFRRCVDSSDDTAPTRVREHSSRATHRRRCSGDGAVLAGTAGNSYISRARARTVPVEPQRSVGTTTRRFPITPLHILVPCPHILPHDPAARRYPSSSSPLPPFLPACSLSPHPILCIPLFLSSPIT
jgi:hypothetical protein